MDVTITVGAAVLSSAAVAGAIVWFARLFITEGVKAAIKSEYDQKLETHKAELKATADISIERLRSELSIEAAKQNYRFAKLHEKRAEVIADLYAKLNAAYRALGDYVAIFEPAGGPSKEERRKAAIDAFTEFDNCYRPNVIFLPPETTEALAKVRQTMVTAFNRFFFSVENQQDNTTNWLEIFESLKGPVAEALRDLENDFRKLLGS